MVTRAAPPGKQRLVHGQPVVADEPCYSPLPPNKNGERATLGMRILTLADGAQLYECGTCYVEPGAEFVGTRGQVLKHRRDNHGLNTGGFTRQKRAARAAAQAAADKIVADVKARRDTVTQAAAHVAAVMPDAPVLDAVLRTEAAPAGSDPAGPDPAESTTESAPARSVRRPAGPLTMPLCEVIDLVMSAGQWGEAMQRLRDEAAGYKARALAAERKNRKYEAAFERLGFVPKEMNDDENGEAA